MTKQEVKFVATVWEHYRRHGRRSLPWRHTKDPYRILISEVMLQQTQVDRIIPKYKDFLRRFPAVKALAEAPLGDVLREWQGLGYNRRAKYLHECAKEVVAVHKGKSPQTQTGLEALPGVGPYTAGAVMAFAYNEPVVMIETNIRAVYLHHFFKNKIAIPDREIVRYIERTLDHEHPREWYWALMDYGAYLKKTFPNPSRKSKHHMKQSAFKGSDREVRGAILRELSKGKLTEKALQKKLTFEPARIKAQLEKLEKEEMLVCTRHTCHLPN